MKDYYYNLQYVNGETSFTYRFPADIDTEKLVRELCCFLKGAGWSDKQIQYIFNERIYDDRYK